MFDRVMNTPLLNRKCSKIPKSIDIKRNMTAKWVKTEINFKKLPEPLTKKKNKTTAFYFVFSNAS